MTLNPPPPRTLNILVSVNTAYLEKAKTMLFSVRLHTECDITVYLFNSSLTDEEVSDFETYLKTKCKMALKTLDTSKIDLSGFPVMNFSIEMYYRIFAQFLVPETVDRLLWLDADIIIRKDIQEFYRQDFDNSPCIVCHDYAYMAPYVISVKKKIGIKEDAPYFNSGVMLLNISLLRETTTFANVINVCHQLRDKLTWPDQDILNVMYGQTAKYVPWEKYNCQTPELWKLSKKLKQETVILHYSSSDGKPWNPKWRPPVAKYYWHVRFRQGDIWQAICACTKISLIEICYLFKALRKSFNSSSKKKQK